MFLFWNKTLSVLIAHDSIESQLWCLQMFPSLTLKFILFLIRNWYLKLIIKLAFASQLTATDVIYAMIAIPLWYMLATNSNCDSAVSVRSDPLDYMPINQVLLIRDERRNSTIRVFGSIVTSALGLLVHVLDLGVVCFLYFICRPIIIGSCLHHI